MRVAVACGGTGGHIFPGLATGHELIRRGHDVTLWLAGKDVESEAVKGWQGRVITVPAQGLPSGLSLRSGVAALKLIRAVHRVKAQMIAERPDVVLAMGSYASVGPVGAAIRLGIPFVLHEANVVPGRTVRLFARYAKAVAGCFEETRFFLRRREVTVTGMPLRPDLLEAAARPRAPHNGPTHLLVMGGSRGAHALNEHMSEALIKLAAAGIAVAATHLTGEADFASISQRYCDAGLLVDTRAFTRSMGEVYARTDFAICRAGAATCAELAAFGLPALLVPYPHAIHDHQTANAKAVEKAGAADLVPEADITTDWLVSYLRRILERGDRRATMARAALARASGCGAMALAELVEQAAGNNPA